MTLHNPENVTPEQVGAGWRLLTTDEITKPLPGDTECWNHLTKTWQVSSNRGSVPCRFNQKTRTWRTQTAPPSPLVSLVTAEIAEKQALLETVKAIEAGAEWEVKSNVTGDWYSPMDTLKCYIRHNHKIRLKPAAPVAPLWDCAADVPMNAWVRFRNEHSLYNLRSVKQDGIGFASFHVDWSEIHRIEYTLDGVTFHPCRKGGPR